MSENSENRIPTNEEIVEELTSNFEKSLGTESPTIANIPDNKDIPPDSFEDTTNHDSDDEEGEEEKSKIVEEIDASDDEELKNLELNLTDEEKEQRRNEALALKKLGNDQFKAAEYVESIKTYSQALQLCSPKFSSDRAILYANRAASKIKVSRKESAIGDCTKAIQLNDTYVRAYLRRAALYEETDKLDESLQDYKKILELDPGNAQALSGVHRLPPLIAERNEKLKNEMLGKLKDLGNVFLRPFGLSTDNFKLQQDPATGGYSVNFQQKS